MPAATTLPEVDAVLAEAAQVYVGVTTSSGPHVTPDLFAVVGGRIVCMVAASTLKARRLRRDERVAVAARAGTGAITLVGRATVLDPAAPASVLTDPGATLASPGRAARFVLGNAAELTGAVIDLVTGRLGGPLPPHRVLIAVTPEAVAALEGEELVAAAGWDGVDRTVPLEEGSAAAPARPVDPHDLPAEVAALPDAAYTVIGWSRDDGAPLALPATWDAGLGEARVPAALFELTGAAPTSPACATFDTWTGYGPSGKVGVMLRGSGEAVAGGAGSTALRLHLDRATHWDGIVTASSELGG